MTVEETVLSIWERVFGGRSAVGPESGAAPGCGGPQGGAALPSFFALGGDAATAADVLSLVRDAYDVEIDPKLFLAAPTVADLSHIIERELEQGRQATAEAWAPLAFSQEGMLWHEQFAPGSFNLPPFVRRYQGSLDVAALERSLSDILGRHAPLRTTFEIVDGRPMQRIRPARPLVVPMTDLSWADHEAQRASVGQAIEDAAGRPFDLSEGPLFDPHLYKLNDDDHVLLIRLHHLAFDDWAVDIFRRELSVLYRSHVAGEVPLLPELRVDFADFCRRQRRRMAGIAGTQELEYWRRELAGAPFSVALPLGDPARPPGSRYPPAVALRHPLGRQSVQPLRVLARGQRSSLYMALLAVFGIVAHGYTGQEDLVMASVVANRNSAELEPLIACFTKKIMLRLRVPGDATFLEVMTTARNSVLGALAHQNLAFETVVQEVLGPDAEALGVVPDVSIMFQADTPHKDRLVLPGLTVGGFDTGTTAAQPHFASGDAEEAGEARPPWGAGLYPGTFLVLSVVEGEGGVFLEARGAFHPPSVERLLDRFDQVLADVVADPTRTVAQLGRPAQGDRDFLAGEQGRGTRVNVRGFLVEPSRIEAVLARCPSVKEVAVAIGDTPSGTTRIVAYVVPAGWASPPTLVELRAFLWSRLPGYAWPTGVVVVSELPATGAEELSPDPPDPPEPPGPTWAPGGPTESSSAALVPDAPTASSAEDILTTVWGEVLGGGPVRSAANYWQKFTFVEALRRAQRCGLVVGAEQVRRNRTVITLAADLMSTGTAP